MRKKNEIKPIAIIPARGGSKRVPKKNVQLLGGIPLLVHTIRFAKNNDNVLSKIFVSTDDPEIKRIAEDEDVIVIDRPEHLSTDFASTVSVMKHVLEVENINDTEVVLLQPTNPLRPAKILSEAYRKFKKGDFDSLMTITRSFKKFGKIQDNHFIPFNYKMGQRSQDLDPLYFENGLLYITKGSFILQEKIIGNNNYPFIVDHPFANVDIDHWDDLHYAEFLLSNLKKD